MRDKLSAPKAIAATTQPGGIWIFSHKEMRGLVNYQLKNQRL
jgi:hypothetical protein